MLRSNWQPTGCNRALSTACGLREKNDRILRRRRSPRSLGLIEVEGPSGGACLGGEAFCAHVPVPSGLSSHSSPALSSRKLPVTGSSTNTPTWIPTDFPAGTSGMVLKEPSEFRRQSLLGATLPPP